MSSDDSQISGFIFCELCNRTIRRKNGITSHVKRIHLRLREHSCPICDLTASNIIDVKRHLRKMHKYADPNHVVSIPKSSYEEELKELSKQCFPNSFITRTARRILVHPSSFHSEPVDLRPPKPVFVFPERNQVSDEVPEAITSDMPVSPQPNLVIDPYLPVNCENPEFDETVQYLAPFPITQDPFPPSLPVPLSNPYLEDQNSLTPPLPSYIVDPSYANNCDHTSALPRYPVEASYPDYSENQPSYIVEPDPHFHQETLPDYLEYLNDPNYHDGASNNDDLNYSYNPEALPSYTVDGNYPDPEF